MDMKKLLQTMQSLDSSVVLTENETMGTPVTASLSITASGADSVGDMLTLLKHAGVAQPEPASAPVMPMRNDIERLRSIVDGDVTTEASEDYTIVPTHINKIRPGDTVKVSGELKTVTKNDIKRDGFMGTTLFGDSYKLGSKMVDLAVLKTAKSTAEGLSEADDVFDVDLTHKGDAYSEGFMDGLYNKAMNNRASSIFGPNTPRYDLGYADGIRARKSAQAAGVVHPKLKRFVWTPDPDEQEQAARDAEELKKYTIVPTHIDKIRLGDKVKVGDQLRTVTSDDIDHDVRFGMRLFGSTYNSGTRPVDLAVLKTANTTAESARNGTTDSVTKAGQKYNVGDEVVVDGNWYTISDVAQDGTMFATDSDGGEIEFIPGSEDSHTPISAESYANEPDETYDDHETMIHDLAGGLNKEKRAYKAAQRGDNAMAVESIKNTLAAQLRAMFESSDEQLTKKVDKNGTIRWYNNDGQLHRLNGPALERTDGSREWYQNNQLHRLDGPAVDRADGYRVWFVDGELHRVDGPAVERADGYRAWYVNDQRHRTDGPAIEKPNGTVEYWINGKELTKAEFAARTGKSKPTTESSDEVCDYKMYADAVDLDEATHSEVKKEISAKLSKMSDSELKAFVKKHSTSQPINTMRSMVTNDVIDAEMKKRGLKEYRVNDKQITREEFAAHTGKSKPTSKDSDRMETDAEYNTRVAAEQEQAEHKAQAAAEKITAMFSSDEEMMAVLKRLAAR